MKKCIFLLLGFLFFNNAQLYAQVEASPGVGSDATTEVAVTGEDDRGEKILKQLIGAKKGLVSISELAEEILFFADKSSSTPEEISDIMASLKKDIPNFAAEFSPKILGKVADTLAKGEEFKFRRLKEIVETIFGRGSVEIATTDHLHTLAMTADRLLKEGKNAELLALASGAKNQAESAVVSPRVSQLVKKNEALIFEDNSLFQAIKGISEANNIFRDKNTIQLAVGILERIDKRLADGTLKFTDWSFDDPSVITFIRNVEQDNPTIKPVVLNIYQQKLFSSLESESAIKLGEYFVKIIERRPDPNSENDALRKEIIFKAKGREARYFAISLLAELKFSGALGAGDKLRVVFKGYYGRFWPSLFLIALIVLILAVSVVIFKPRFLVRAFSSSSSPMNMDAETIAAADSSPGKVRRQSVIQQAPGGRGNKTSGRHQRVSAKASVSGYAKPATTTDEYSRLLEFFGLDDSATEADIKRAYRDMVKNHHPDRQPGSSPQPGDPQNDSFIELKEVYDRILEIRGSWFGGRK